MRRPALEKRPPGGLDASLTLTLTRCNATPAGSVVASYDLIRSNSC